MADVLRVLAVIVASTTYGLAVANLVVSFLVLRDKPFTWRHFLGTGGGFLWGHIVFVTVPFQGFVTWGSSRSSSGKLTRSRSAPSPCSSCRR